MRRAIFCLSFIGLTRISHGAVIASWSFEPPFTDLTNSATGPSISATVGSGTATGLHASANADWSTPSGNGSTDAFSVNEWAIGDYFEFSFSTTGFEDIIVMWDQTRSGTGVPTFDMEYSVGAGAFITASDNYSVAQVTWNNTTPQSGSSFTVNLSAFSALDDAGPIRVRLRADAAASGTGGTVRVDNFVVSGTPIPEPGIAVLSLAALGMLVRRRR